MDTEQNQRLQDEEEEIVRLWNARNTVFSRLESSKQPISSPIDDNVSISEIQSRYNENESIVSQSINYLKVERNLCIETRKKKRLFSFSSRYERRHRKIHR